MLQTQIHSLNHFYVELMKEQDETKKALEEAYGKVNIDLKDGSYELIPEKNEEDK